MTEVTKFNLECKKIGSIKTKSNSANAEKVVKEMLENPIRLYPQMREEEIPENIPSKVVEAGIPDFYENSSDFFVEVKSNRDVLSYNQLAWIEKYDYDVRIYTVEIETDENNPKYCNECDREFDSEWALERHINFLHPDEKVTSSEDPPISLNMLPRSKFL